MQAESALTCLRASGKRRTARCARALSQGMHELSAPTCGPDKALTVAEDASDEAQRHEAVGVAPVAQHELLWRQCELRGLLHRQPADTDDGLALGNENDAASAKMEGTAELASAHRCSSCGRETRCEAV